MSNAPRDITFALIAGASLAGCGGQASDQNISIDNGVDANAEIEAVPADESSATPAGQLGIGVDNADVADLNDSNTAD